MREVDFLSRYQNATKRDYVGRVVEHDKAESATIARQWGADYWDGERRYGYGGNKYDGRWLPIAQDMAKHYGLKPGDRVLDIGCGKAFLLYELTRAVPGLQVAGLDISKYGLENAKEEVRPFLKLGNCTSLPFDSHSFDYVLTINTFHNLEVFDLKKAVQEVERVGKDKKWICVESFRNEREKANLLYWQLTCYGFHTPAAWTWLYKEWGYTGDYGFIYFE
ncbi:MAG: class I SAM-dependent methyltransferase [Alphaproteobacteria bacterium]|nr:class I SAM-dependent methyltransferase [Alphaproteobacteria bacterium]